MRERNYGIDLFKMFAMYLVCVLHVLGQGGVVVNTEKLSVNYMVAWAVTLFAYISVDCFALTSGYVSYKSKFKPRRIIELYLIVLFYGVVFLILFSVLNKENFSLNNVLLTVFPSLNKTNQLYYWYFTAYLILFMLSPFINYIINAFDRKKLAYLLLILLVMFSVVPAFMQTDYFHTTSGYSYLWIITLYFLGAFLKKYDVFRKIKSYKLFLLLCASVAFTVCGHIMVNIYYSKYSNIDIESQSLVLSNQYGIYSNFLKPSMFANYTFPTTVISSVLLMGLFSKIRIKNTFLQNKISSFIPLVFSVYIIHTNKFIFEQVIAGLFEGYAELNPVLLALAVLGTALAIFVICIMIDMLRFELFKLLKVDKLCLFIENKLIKLWNIIFEKKSGDIK
ncbi:MAG: acyltransferase [Clostridia bacterium]|nr:acyltransferase [Clostridia bacterium]